MFKERFLPIPLLCIFIGSVITACNGGDGISGPCGGPTYRSYDVNGYDLTTAITDEVRGPDLPSDGELYTEGEPAQHEALLITLVTDIELLASQTQDAQRLRFSLFNRAYACSPVPPSPNEEIASINITSSNNFNDIYPAGTSLNGVFNVVYTDASADFARISGDATEFFSLEEYLQQEEVTPSQLFQLVLNTEPTSNNVHQFDIEIIFTNGKVFEISTSQVTFDES